MPDIAEELAHAKMWLVDTALPLWASTGFDNTAGLFEERLDFSGRAVLGIPHRLMVQCRQIYVYSHATLLGWHDGRALVEQTLASLLQTYGKRVHGVPYVFSVTRDGAVADARQDTYAYAFVLFALAWARRALGDVVKTDLAAALIEHLRGALLDASGAGFIDGLPRPDDRLRQNPQMHLMEAALEVEEVFGLDESRRLAEDLFHLFRDRLFSRRDASLPEVYEAGWSLPIANPSFEPGHHFEWMWLLERYAARWKIDLADTIRALAYRAFAEGIDADGIVIDAVRIVDGARTDSRRCWATCEALKAAGSYSPGAVGQNRAARFLNNLRSKFLSGPFPGGWIDSMDGRGFPTVDYVPASTLYHVVLAITETDRVFGPSGTAL